MAQYTLLDPLTGDTSTVAASKLTQHLRVNRILLHAGKHIGIITHRDVVSFCRWCAEKALAQCQVVPPEARAALELVDKWLIDPGSASREELKQAADAAWGVGGADSVAWFAAADAAWGAAEAVWAAARVTKAADASYEAQAQWLVEHLKSNQ